MTPAYHGVTEGQGPAASWAMQVKSMSLWQSHSLLVAAEMEKSDWSRKPHQMPLDIRHYNVAYSV